MSAVTRHRAFVWELDGDRAAVCLCGWSGPLRTPEVVTTGQPWLLPAQEDAARHVAEHHGTAQRYRDARGTTYWAEEAP